MAEIKYPKRCVEKVAMAELAAGVLLPHVLGTAKKLAVGAKQGDLVIEAIALHPAGLFVQRSGRRVIIPLAQVSYLELAENE